MRYLDIVFASLEFYFGEKKELKVSLLQRIMPSSGKWVSKTWDRCFSGRIWLQTLPKTPNNRRCEPIQSIKMTFETEACSRVTSAGMESYCQILCFFDELWYLLKCCIGRWESMWSSSHAKCGLSNRIQRVWRCFQSSEQSFQLWTFQIAIIIQNQRTSYYCILYSLTYMYCMLLGDVGGCRMM